MNIRQVEIFLQVCQEKSITGAAEKLFISQPAVSKSITDLEKQLAVSLFDRINGRLLLNEQGRWFRLQAEVFWESYQKLTHFGQDIRNQLPLRIGVSLTIAAEQLFEALAIFKGDYPDTPLKIYAENVKSIQKRLLAGEIDVGFIEGTIHNDYFETRLLSKFQLICVAAPALSAQQSTPAQVPWLLREPGSSLRDTFDQRAAEQELAPQILLESSNIEVLIKAAQKGLGVTILPADIAEQYLRRGDLRQMNFEHFEMVTRNHVVLLKGKQQDEKMQVLIKAFMAK